MIQLDLFGANKDGHEECALSSVIIKSSHCVVADDWLVGWEVTGFFDWKTVG